jgi:hypothetical protein
MKKRASLLEAEKTGRKNWQKKLKPMHATFGCIVPRWASLSRVGR